jgi:hypothetical protein
MRTIGVISSQDLLPTGRGRTSASGRPEQEAAVPAHASWLPAVLHRWPGRGGSRTVDRAAGAPRREQPMPFC